MDNNMTKTMFFSIIILMSFVEMLAMYNLKEYVLTDSSFYYIMGMTVYFVAINIFVYLFRFDKIGIVNVSWNVMSSILSIVLGYIFFKEYFNTRECVGVSLSIAGLFLMNFK